MDPADEKTLWKAPQKGRDARKELMDGFDPNDYPGDGPYFAFEREFAERWAKVYQNGLQEVRLSRLVFEELARQGLIMEDSYYPGQACHVLPAGLGVFNESIKDLVKNKSRLSLRERAFFRGAKDDYSGKLFSTMSLNSARSRGAKKGTCVWALSPDERKHCQK